MKTRTPLLLSAGTLAVTLILAPRVVVPCAATSPTQAASARQNTAAPNATSPAERQFLAWLDVFNRGQRAELTTFFRDHFPARAGQEEETLAFREETGGFDVVKTESATPTRTTVIVRERAGEEFARGEMEVEADRPHRILRLGLRVIPRPADQPLPTLTESQLITALREKVEADAARDRFSGAVLLARHGKVLFSTAKGMADREKRTPNTLDTRFRVGSMNKMFTATAVLQLVQAGKVSLEAPVGRYLSDYPNKEVATKVTVHHLLTHTGGTGDIFGPEYEKHRLGLRTLADYAKLYGQRALRFEPGTKWEYSNYGFILAGLIVERVSGQSYYDYVRDHIFKPAGMHSSGSEPEEQAVPNRAVGYMRAPGGVQPNTNTLPWRGTSAGGGYTTVGDLLRFATALTSHTLLDPKHTALLTTGKVETGRGPSDKYAYGFIDGNQFGARSFGHGGGAPGMNGDLRIFPASGYVIAALVNADAGAGRTVQWIAGRLPR